MGDGMLDMTYEDLNKEIEKARKRAAKATFIEAKKEMAEETYPLMSAMVEFFGERFERMERALAEIIDQTESFVQPELAEQILQTVELARALSTTVLKLRVGPLDAMTLKRLQAMATSLQVATGVTEEAVMAVTVDPGDNGVDEGEPDEADDASDGDDDEEETIGDPEPSPAEATSDAAAPDAAAPATPTETQEQR